MTRQLSITPVVTPNFLDDAPFDPFVKGDLASDIPDSLVNGSIYARISQPIPDLEDDDALATKIINNRKDWAVDIYWQLQGALVSAFGGSWSPKIFLESQGADDLDVEIVTATPIPFGCAAPGGDDSVRNYHARYVIPADAVLAESPQGTPYEVNVATIYLTPCTQLPGAFVGFVALEDILVYGKVYDPNAVAAATA